MARSSFWRTLRWVRVAVAGLSLAAVTLAFGAAADLLALMARWGLESLEFSAESAEGLAVVAKTQFGPALMAVGARFSVGAGVTVALVLLLTALLGRAYCSVACPLGVLQDVLGMLFFWRRNRPQPRLLLLRKGLGVAVWAMALVGGWTLALRFLDPYTLFGRIAAWFWLPLVVLALLTFWRRRFFCNSFCPVGALLACGTALAPLGFRFTDRCVKCGKCVAACPVGCLDPKTATFDNGRCIRCLACVAICPVDAIAYGRNPGFRVPGRRAFVRAGALLAGGAAVGMAARKAVPLYSAYGPRTGVAKEGIYPPGAGSRQRFLSKCTDCGLCVKHCVGKVLQPAGTFGAVHLTFDEGMCEFYCKRCIEVCPTGALLPLDLKTKQRTRLGLAALDLGICVAATEGFDCGACAEHCPTGALRMKEDADGIRIPTLDTRLCIGCGSCEHPCPVRPIKAVRVWPVDVQTLAADPAEIFKSSEPENTGSSDEWLI